MSIAVMGHNLPPTDEAILQEKLAENSKFSILNMDIILKTEIPVEITEDNAKIAAKFIDDIKKLAKTFDKEHSKEKAPYLSMGRVVDGFFKSKITALEEYRKKYSKPVNDYLTKKAEAEREVIRARAEAARIAAEELAKQAEVHESEDIKDTANELLDAALQKEEKATALDNYADSVKASNLTKIRTESGVVLSQRTSWKAIRNDDPIEWSKLGPYLKEEAIQIAANAAVKDGIRELGGFEIKQVASI